MEISQKILEVADAYQRMYGTSDIFKKYQIAQMVHESANGTSQLAIENNNYGGLTQSEWNGDENKQPDGDNYYRTFSSPEEYARAMHDDYFVYYPEIHNATTAGEYAHILKENGYYGADEMEYGQSLASIANETYVPSENMGRYYAGVTGLEKGIGKRILDFSDDTFVPMVDTNIGGFWKQTKDSFLNEWYNNGSVALLRRIADGIGDEKKTPIGWQPNESDRSTINHLFKGDLETQHFLLSTARSQDQLYRLIEQKREDKAREERVEKAGYGVKSLGGLVGTLLDPLNLIPVLGQEAVLANMAMRLGSKTIANIGLNKALQIAEVGITNGLINMGDQWLANKYGGYTPDYTTAFLFGGAMGAGAKYLHSLSSTDKRI
ncbi:MAG: glucosaminidase domain-containing protein, partial [Veillonella sp.]|nr:glucosaminidase domain-containing protein [Veillonella sp.]